MNKKLFTILTLLLCVCSGAWAQDATLIKVETTSGTTNEAFTLGTVGSSNFYVTITPANDSKSSYGTGNYYYARTATSENYIQTSAVWKIGGKIDGSSRKMVFHIPSAGKLYVYARTGKSGESRSITVNETTVSFDAPTATVNSKSCYLGREITFTESGDYSATATASINFSAFEFVPTEAQTQWNKPTITETYNPATENYTITISAEEGATIKYTVDGGSEQTYSAPFTAAPGAVIVAYATDGSATYTDSETSTLTVSAKPAVATPAYSVGSYDYENGGYPVTITCATDGATIKYKKVNHSNDVTAADFDTDAADYTGTFYAVNTKIAIMASKTGYTTSFDRTGSRYTINTAPSAESPETLIAFTTNDNGDKGIEHVYRSVTIGADNAIAGVKPDGQGLKLRTNQNSNTVTINVKEGYTVTKFSVTGYSNNTLATIPMSDIKFDGTTPDDFSAVTFPVSTDEPVEYVQSGIRATDNIVMTFDNSNIDTKTDGKKNYQVVAAIKVWYEKNLPGPADPEVLGGDAVTWDFSSEAAQTAAGTITNTDGAESTLTATDGTSTLTYVGGGQFSSTSKNSVKYYYLNTNGSTGRSGSSAPWRRYMILNITTSGTLTFESCVGNPAINYTIYQYSSNDFASAKETTAVATGATSSSNYSSTTSTINVDNGSWIFVTFTSQSYINKMSWTPVSDNIVLTTTANMNGYRAFYDADKGYTLDVNTTAYVVSKSDVANQVTLSAIDNVPAATPVILKTTDGERKMTLTKATVDAFAGTNLLKFTTSGQDLSAGVYRLGYSAADGVGFYPYATASAAAGIVYLDKSDVASADPSRGITLVFDDDNDPISTSINGVHGDWQKTHGELFDLQGRRVAQPAKGLYIVNGKKIIIK